MANATFYFEWLGVDKNQFRILSLLAPNGEFRGNLSDMCRSLNLALQTRNRKSLKSAISALIEGGYITSEQKGNTISLKTIPQKTVIEIPSADLLYIDRFKTFLFKNKPFLKSKFGCVGIREFSLSHSFGCH